MGLTGSQAMLCFAIMASSMCILILILVMATAEVPGHTWQADEQEAAADRGKTGECRHNKSCLVCSGSGYSYTPRLGRGRVTLPPPNGLLQALAATLA